MFQLIERPVFFPGRTLFGDTQGPVVDTSVELPVGGHVYLSVVEAIHVGKAVDMVEGPMHEEAVASLEATIVDLEAQVAELTGEVAKGVQVVPVAVLETMLAAQAAKAEPETARRGRRAAQVFGTSVNGGTGAGSKWRPDPTLKRCECGSFIAKLRADNGATLCVRCETESDRIKP